MGIVAEGGLALGHIELVVEESCQVLDPHRGALWEESLAATQLLLQLRDIQLITEEGQQTRAQSKQHGEMREQRSTISTQTGRPLCRSRTMMRHVMCSPFGGVQINN